jgi:hypothetical protein
VQRRPRFIYRYLLSQYRCSICQPPLGYSQRSYTKARLILQRKVANEALVPDHPGGHGAKVGGVAEIGCHVIIPGVSDSDLARMQNGIHGGGAGEVRREDRAGFSDGGCSALKKEIYAEISA